SSGEAQEPEESKAKTAALSVKTTEHDGPAVLNRIHHDSGADYARVTIYTGSQVPYKFGRLPATNKRPNPRIYIDLKGAHLDPHLKRSIAVGNGVLKRIRFGPFKRDVVRVVLDLKALGDLKVVPMDSPARIIVDVSASADKVARIIGAKTAKPNKLAPKVEPKSKTKPKIKPKTKPHIPSKKDSRPGASLSMLAGLKIRRIAVDAGHGGRDPGAIGPKGTFEKTLTLDIAKRLAKLLKADKKLALKEVILTRDRDKYVALEKRTAIANAKKADLFISIHCNAHRNRRFRGVETFYLDLTNDRYSIKLAARENATTEKTISDLRYILADLALKSHVDDSISLGRAIQKALVGKLRRHHKRIKDLRLKPALFYVLIGARMPSVLVETSFLSNREEEKRLRTKKYRQQVAEGIYRGIVNFLAERDRF
ncbi:MAG: N-acetylmuramoyl-L-alanine amidase, partial [Deltaproteobacteria bacterium]|nr:N-acetylmuramoyl-L-alanine amidase [Deltaproteobacteria bacterium]